jgi:photosystem II stability/assembly factor-like uncharacterized protein
MVLIVGGAVACDDDPEQPTIQPLTPDILVADTIGQQEALRVVFPRAVDPVTALDPSNFIVTNLCSGLRVPGALRLVGDTLIFSPTTRLPFLTPLAVRIQNILDPSGNGLAEPVTFRTITEAPPVRDASWEFLNSPTGDQLLSTSFISRDTGYISQFGGKIFKTTNGGAFFAALFKDEDITGTRLRALNKDTLYLIGAASFGGTTSTTSALFRSANGGVTFTPVLTRSPSVFRSLTVRRVGNTAISFIAGDINNFMTLRFDEATDSVHQNGPYAGSIALSAQLSRDGSKAIASGRTTTTPRRGVARRSTDGGRTLIDVTLPSVPVLTGAGFIDNTNALVVGDSSTVLMINVATGAVTVRGAAQGIPQTEINGDTTTIYQFNDVEFTTGGFGWIVGQAVVKRPNVPDFVRGIILFSRNGGASFERQAISGARNNGLDFPAVLDIEALNPDFVTLTGSEGLIAARKVNAAAQLTACTFVED